MKKGSRRKLEIQKVTKKLILERGYSAVTMSEIANQLNLSAGGLYYHYHSVEEIFFDMVKNETNTVWDAFANIYDLENLIMAFRPYFQAEKSDLLHIENTLNAIFYQYYFSFPSNIRKQKMQAAYDDTITNIQAILKKVYTDPRAIEQLCHHVYVMLNGLTVLALTGRISDSAIVCEFEETEQLMRRLYEQKEVSE